jgi:hypothetical protein
MVSSTESAGVCVVFVNEKDRITVPSGDYAGLGGVSGPLYGGFLKTGGREANTVLVGCVSFLCRVRVGCASGVRRVYVGVVSTVCMARPEVDDEILEMAHEICDEAVTVPLPADELSTNQKLRIVVSSAYETLEEDNIVNTVDEQYEL